MNTVIVKYNNRKLYNRESSKYVTLGELLAMPMGSFQVIQKETGLDITIETLLSALTNPENKEVKVKAMQHCLNVWSV
jgi:polyhydroxyalkanoate synthesis regulator protein